MLTGCLSMRMNLNRSDSSVTCEKVAEVCYVRYLIHLHRFTVTERVKSKSYIWAFHFAMEQYHPLKYGSQSGQVTLSSNYDLCTAPKKL